MEIFTRVITEFGKWISSVFYLIVDIEIFGVSVWKIISLIVVFTILEIIIKSINRQKTGEK